ncbi:MAG: hypothetical protein DRP45_09225 [Candidatus Zixiibacteriota bacterium]|nr:MAG: hypothetical protein DRP45_09225 [candidate division Zixibacteria bacterium]
MSHKRSHLSGIRALPGRRFSQGGVRGNRSAAVTSSSPSVGGERITATTTFDIDLAPAFPSGSPVYTVPTGKVLKISRVSVRHKTHSNDGVNAFIKWLADVIEIVAPFQLAATAVNGVDENITPPDMVFVAGDVVAMIITVVGTHTDNEAVASMEGVLYDA